MKRILVGTVASDKASKTLRVEIERRFQHRKYGKIVRGRTVCHVHDENEDAAIGDLVEIVEAQPRSKTKRWDLVRIVKKADDVKISAASAAVAEPSTEVQSDAGANPDAETKPDAETETDSGESASAE